MIIYHVTIKIEPELAVDWLSWMKHKHIPAVMATGLFLSYRICQMLFIEETDGVTYSIQYTLENEDKLHEYNTEFAPALQKEHMERYRDRFIAYRTVHEIIGEGVF